MGLPELVAALLLVAPANAETTASSACGSRDEILQRLASGYDEAVVARGLTGNGALLEVTAAESGETWTIIVTLPAGPICLVAAGAGWLSLVRQSPGRAM